MGAPTRFQNGVTNNSGSNALGMMGQLDPTLFHTYFNDFDTFLAGEWTVTNVGVTPTIALTAVDGGAILQTNTAGIADSAFLQKVGASFTFAAGRKVWFKARFQVSDATESSIVFGLQVVDTTPLAVSDGMYFLKADGAATYSFISATGSVLTTAAAVGTITAATMTELSFYFDGVNEVQYFSNGTLLGRMAVATLPTGLVTVSFGMANGEAAVKTMTTDYIFAAQER
ncbi:MAG: hypothetical protein JZU60_02695 [Ilumatobacteraceae bacterium]|nr:hypothetical protein [Ilumatobacteraceae bacterium]